MPRSKTPEPTFKNWLASAKPGEVLTYHIASKHPNDKLFIAAWEAYVEDKVALFQKRVDGVLHYVAVATSPRIRRFLARAPRLAGPAQKGKVNRRAIGASIFAAVQS